MGTADTVVDREDSCSPVTDKLILSLRDPSFFTAGGGEGGVGNENSNWMIFNDFCELLSPTPTNMALEKY